MGSGNSLFVSMTIDEFKQFLIGIIQNELKEHIKSDPKVDDDELMKIEDVQLLLGSASKPTSKPTIHSYKKKYNIPVYRFGRRIYFKRKELLECMKKHKL